MKPINRLILTTSPLSQPARKPRRTAILIRRQRSLYGRKRRYSTGKELDTETGLYYYGARYLDGKTSRWLSGDPAVGGYVPEATVDDGARKRNGSLPGMGGVFNYVNLHVYHYAGNNPVRLVDPDGNSTWISIEGTDWWYRYDQAKAGDKSHFHFLKGKDPRSSRAEFYNRRVYVNERNPDGSTKQNNDRGGRQGRGGVDRNVPEEIIQMAIGQKGSGVNFDSVKLSEPLFGLLGVETLDRVTNTVNPHEEGYPIWGNGNPLQMNYSVTRNKETGDLDYTLLSVVNQRNGDILRGGVMLPITPDVLPMPSIIPLPNLVPAY